MIEDSKDNDQEIIWLKENAHKYGYILRYPLGKENITGFNYEFWNFRFVVIEVALKIKKYKYFRRISSII